jgi:hypothetical protein
MFKIINFLISCFALIAFLFLLNNINKSKTGSFKEYNSLDEVKSITNITNIYLPTYFPSSIKWPPAKIYAQTQPVKAIVTEYVNKNNEIVLEIFQIHHKKFNYKSHINIKEILEESFLNIKNHKTKIYSGFCSDREYCSRIEIAIEKGQLTLIGKLQVQELLKIAKSITVY